MKENKAKLLGLVMDEALTYGQLKKKIGVSDTMMAEYLRELQNEDTIEILSYRGG
jgi:DNA-binding HxlR family transcriptional regulator